MLEVFRNPTGSTATRIYRNGCVELHVTTGLEFAERTVRGIAISRIDRRQAAAVLTIWRRQENMATSNPKKSGNDFSEQNAEIESLMAQRNEARKSLIKLERMLLFDFGVTIHDDPDGSYWTRRATSDR
jgi:hypothetical protein